MKLIIKRDQEQKKGLLGGNKGIEFTLSFKVELTPEEKSLIEKAKVDEYILTRYMPFDDREIPLTVKGIVEGKTSTQKSVQLLLDLEDKIKIGCQNLKSLLEVIESFGGEEVIEFS